MMTTKWNEIKQQYKGQVVGLENVVFDDNDNIVSANVKYSTENTPYSEIMLKSITENIYVRNLNAELKGTVGIVQ